MLTQTAIFGDGEVEPSKDTAVCICVETCRCGLPKLLANKLALLDFEARKDAAQARSLSFYEASCSYICSTRAG